MNAYSRVHHRSFTKSARPHTVVYADPSPEPANSPPPLPASTTTTTTTSGVMKSELRNVDDGVDLSYDRHHQQQQHHQQQLHLFQAIKNESSTMSSSSSPIKQEAIVVKTEFSENHNLNSNNSSSLRSSLSGGRLKFFKGKIFCVG